MPIQTFLPSRLRPLALAIAATLGGAAWSAHAEEGIPLREQRELLPRATDPDDKLPTFVTGDHIGGVPDREVLIEGAAELRRGGMVLRADRIHYQQVEDQLDADGHVRLQTPEGNYTGPRLQYELDTENGQLGAGDFFVNATSGHGSAQATEFEGRDLIKMHDADYSTCPVGDNSWFVRARELTIDNAEQQGQAHGATVVFKGMPILATPYISFPVGEESKSGFLTPSFGVTSTRGVEVVAPYYFAIAPNRDYTLIPRYYSKRGLQLGNEFRYLGTDYHGDLRGEYLSNDAQTGTRRWSFGATHSQSLGNGFGAYWNIDRVSDDDYVADFSRTIVLATNRQLTQEAGLGYYASYWNSTLRVQHYQVLQDPASPIAIPYYREPQLTLNAARYDRYGFDLALGADVTRFEHPTYVTGSRAVLTPSISYPLIAPGAYLTPRLSYSLAQYSLDSARITSGSLLDTNYGRAIPTASIDSGLTFERDAHYFGNDFLQTLEPRVYYVYTPYRNQNGAPLFDTSTADFNYAQLFSENRFSGLDRIGDANQLTLAVQSRLIEPDTGLERLRVILGERFYFSDQRVGLDSSTQSTASKSDLLAGIGGDLTDKLSADLLVQYDAATSRASKSNLGVHWAPERGKVFSANYRYTRGSIEQYDFSAQWKLTPRWYGVGRLNYSTYDKRLVEATAGFEYDGGCWVFRMVAQKFVTSSTSSTTSLFFQLELNGFSSVGSSPLDALSRSVTGYQKINPEPTSTSRFVQYE